MVASFTAIIIICITVVVVVDDCVPGVTASGMLAAPMMALAAPGVGRGDVVDVVQVDVVTEEDLGLVD